MIEFLNIYKSYRDKLIAVLRKAEKITKQLNWKMLRTILLKHVKYLIPYQRSMCHS